MPVTIYIASESEKETRKPADFAANDVRVPQGHEKI